MRKRLAKVRSWLEQIENIDTIFVEYADVIAFPLKQARQGISFLRGELDSEATARGG